MSRASIARKSAAAAIISGQYDDGLNNLYSMDLSAPPGHIQHAGRITRTGILFGAGASGLGNSVKSV